MVGSPAQQQQHRNNERIAILVGMSREAQLCHLALVCWPLAPRT